MKYSILTSLVRNVFYPTRDTFKRKVKSGFDINRCLLFIVCSLWSVAAFSQQPASNWRLQPIQVEDSYNNTVLKNSLSTKTNPNQPTSLLANSNRTLTFKLPATPQGGMLVFTPNNDIASLRVSTSQSIDGKNWTVLNNNAYLDGFNGNLQKTDIPKTQAETWFKVTFQNNSSSNMALSDMALYDFKATNGTSKNPYFILLGASITVSTGGNAEWLATLKARVGNYDAVFFNLSVGGDNTNSLYTKIDGLLTQHPNAGYALLEIGGNDVSAQRVLTFADYKGSYIQNMDFQIREIVRKIKAAGKDVALSRISYRNYPDKTNYMGKFQPSVNGGKNQENGSLPYNFVIDKIIKETNPAFWNESEKRGILDFYQFTLNNQQWLVAGDGVHFYGGEAFHIRDFWADYALKYFFTGQRSSVVPYTEFVTNLTNQATQAVVKAESTRSEQDVFNARILVEQLNTTATRFPLLNRLDAVLGIVPPPQAITFTVTKTDVVNCYGEATGSITVNASGGTSPYQFSINNSSFTGNNGIFTNLTANNYNIIIKDNTGTTAIVPTVTISQPSQLAANVVSQTDAGCQVNDGSINVNVSGGTAPYQFSVNNTPFAPGNGNFVNLSAGNYTIRVKDAKNCTVSMPSVSINQIPPLSVTIINIKDVSCAGGNDGGFVVQVSGGTQPYLFAVNTDFFGAGSGIFQNMKAGSYTVWVKDKRGCTVYLPAFEIKEPKPLTAPVTKTDVSCPDAKDGSLTITAAGGTAPYFFSINGSPFQPENTFGSLAAGFYSFTVKDSKNCQITNNLSIENGKGIFVGIASMTHISCFGGADGRISVSLNGGTPPYQYSVNNSAFFENNTNFTGLKAGAYQILVKDSKGCTASFPMVTLTQPPLLVLTLSSKTDISCTGNNDGQVKAEANGGAGSYIFSLDEQTEANNTGIFTKLLSGRHTITVTDRQGCSQKIEFTINEPAKLVLTLKGKNEVVCFGGKEGQIAVNVSGGMPDYRYFLNNIEVTTNAGTFTGLAAGTYNILIKDKNGCSAEMAGIVLSQPATGLTLSLKSKTDILCFGADNGQISVEASGGNPAYKYFIDKQELSNSDGIFTEVSPGNHILTVKDANGCAKTLDVNLTESPKLEIQVKESMSPTNANSKNGSITVEAIGGSPEYEFALNNGVFVNNAGKFIGLPGGIYTVTVKDKQGCTVKSQAIVLQNGFISLPVTIDIFPNPSASGYIRINLTTTDFLTPCSVQITDLMGRVFYEKVFNSELLVSGILLPENRPLPKGMYLLFITQGQTIVRSRFIIE